MPGSMAGHQRPHRRRAAALGGRVIAEGHSEAWRFAVAAVGSHVAG
uniref:Predicted protein n=1 Tax=Hordeum vulgare subsp. vulgare TaxID=112509 RepID=F2CY94_HORVV|nr:predicted protein [Hordeum vulgare subsp. vulgare]